MQQEWVQRASGGLPEIADAGRYTVAPTVLLMLFAVILPVSAATADDRESMAATEFKNQIQPLVQRYCCECHSGDLTEAEIDLGALATIADMRRATNVWLKVRGMLDSGQMPPKDSPQPTEEERMLLRTWIRSFLRREAEVTAGDPGPVVLRRLNNEEYNYTVRDLTGVAALDPTREFPVDGAAGEGFINTGSAQSMSPSFVTKYLDAAQEVASHAVLLPDGITFSSGRSRREWIDERLTAIRQFYDRFTSPTEVFVEVEGTGKVANQGGVIPLDRYFAATLEERDALASGCKTISTVAKERSLNAKYLSTLWQTMTAPSSGPRSLLIDNLREKWRKSAPVDAPKLANLIGEVQKQLWEFHSIGRLGEGANQKTWMHPVKPDLTQQEQSSSLKSDEQDLLASLRVLAGQNGVEASELDSAMSDFRNLFPAAVCYSGIVPTDEVVTMTMYFREDEHLQRLMLNENQFAELDRLWDELFYVAQEPLALTVVFEQNYEFATQDRPELVIEFGPMRKPINDRADAFRKRLLDTEPAHINAVLEFADRAWRRPLTDSDEAGLREFYKQLRASDITHDESIRLTLARVLTSPAFLYRREQPAPGTDSASVTSSELATRLSYFLWSSLPDERLREVADAGRLNSDEALLEQTQRMLNDSRTRRLAIQFACQWLHLRDFDRNDDKNEKLYPEFAILRQDMYEETVRFFEDMFRNDGSILELLDADHTFLNESLAKHYDIEGVTGSEWRRVDGVHSHGRGGVFGMASFLASQSGASRTSPILRGNWVYETLLGERLPRPPTNVPLLPETVPEGLTARQLIERHSSDAACVKCHKKIDPFGFALEQFDAIGRRRPVDVDTRTIVEDGTQIEGLDGMRLYLLTQRQNDVVRQFCRKLLGFALGREVQLSDELLLDDMQRRLAAEGFRFSVVVKSIVTSKQFRQIRGSLTPDNEPSAGDHP